jgi:hypothetical protein
MQATARKLEPAPIGLEYATVREGRDDEYQVAAAAGAVSARRSLSCLVEPEPGDLVLLSVDGFGRGYILSVLERGQDTVRLSFPGDVELKLPHGALRAAAAAGVDLVTAGACNLVAGSLTLHAGEAELNAGQVRFFGGALEAGVQRIKVVAETCDQVFDRISQRVLRSYRWVAETEQVEAGHLHYLVKKLMSFRGQYAALTAEKDVRIDGDKILMG